MIYVKQIPPIFCIITENRGFWHLLVYLYLFVPGAICFLDVGRQNVGIPSGGGVSVVFMFIYHYYEPVAETLSAIFIFTEVMIMKARKIRVLKVAPGEHPQVVMLENDLDALQKAVSIGCDYQGLIEVVGLDDGVCIICNEEGKLLGLEGNRRLGGDIIAGVFYVVGEDKCGNFVSLTEAQIQHYTKRFWAPEVFLEDDITDMIYAFIHMGL